MFLPFSSDELAAMRAEAVLTFTQTATINRRQAPIQDDRGGTEGTLSSAGSVACLLQPIKIFADQNEDTSGGDQLGTTSQWHCLMPYGTGVVEGDTLTIDGATYDVLGTNSARGIPIYDDAVVTRAR